MKAAVVQAAGQPPVYADFAEPEPLAGHHVVEVAASALSQVTRARAAGAHYSSPGALPFVAGVDGVGRLEDGRRVYFFGPRAPFGAMAQRCLVPATHCVALPDTLEPVTAAALAIPGLSSWAALTERARFAAGETVLVNGATGTSGRLAIQIAKHLGARRIVATGRDAASLDALAALGADVTVSLAQDEAALCRAFEPLFADGVDVVLDYLWGPSARALLVAAARATAEARALRFVQIGSIGGAELSLPGSVLRAAAITLLGSGIGSVALPRLLAAVQAVFDAAGPAGLRVATEAVPLAQLASYWAGGDGRVRTVFTPQPS